MPLTADLVGTALAPTTFEWSATDAILYALGVGARPPHELPLLDETKGPAVLPSFALIASWWAVKDLRATLDVGTPPIVHSAQSLELVRPMQASGRVDVSARISGLWDTGKHALVEVTGHGRDADSPLFETRSQTMVLGLGDFGGERGPRPPADPEGAPGWERVDDVRPEQAAIYRLSGDRNPLHIDPEAAKRAGFDDVFLHGLCTLGFAARAIVASVGEGDPQRLQAISCRFAKPVAVSGQLRTEMWGSPDAIQFRTSQGGTVALSAGTARLFA